MKAKGEPGVFRPTMSKMETRTDTTTRVAREIVDGEAAARVRQMERLRAARLEREAAAEPVAPGKAKTRR